jgi:hypothetical protein
MSTFVITLSTGLLAIDVLPRSQPFCRVNPCYIHQDRSSSVDVLKRMRRLILPEAEAFSKPSMYVLAIASMWFSRQATALSRDLDGTARFMQMCRISNMLGRGETRGAARVSYAIPLPLSVRRCMQNVSASQEGCMVSQPSK